MSGINVVNISVTAHSNNIKDSPLNKISKEPSSDVKYQVYSKRWIILLLYCFSLICAMSQSFLYVVISDILIKYYDISYSSAQWTSLIGSVTLLTFIFPGIYLVDRLGLRLSLIIGLCGTCIGSWIKVGSVDPSRFWVLLLGQGVESSFKVLISPLPSRIAAVWFGKSEVSKACSIAVSSIPCGIILGNLLPSLIVERGSVEIVEEGLFNLGLTVAIFSAVMLALVILFFSKEPPTPPSQAQYHKQNEILTIRKFANSVKTVFSNRSYVLLLLLFGICFGMDSCLPTVLNQIVGTIHPDAEEHIGYLGTTSTVSGFIGSFVLGYILDKYKNYRVTTISIFVLYAVCIITFLSTLQLYFYLIYFTYALEGFMSIGIMVTSFQLAVELTYPEPESTTGAMLLCSMQAFGIGLTYLYGYLFNNVNGLLRNSIFSLILIGSLSLLFCIKFDLRRQTVENKKPIN